MPIDQKRVLKAGNRGLARGTWIDRLDETLRQELISLRNSARKIPGFNASAAYRDLLQQLGPNVLPCRDAFTKWFRAHD